MPLSLDARRGDKDNTSPERIPKLYLSRGMLEHLRKYYPGVAVREWRGRLYVDVRDFESTSFIRAEPTRSTRQWLSFAILKFCRFLNSFPDDLIAKYRRDVEADVRDLRSFYACEMERYSGNYVRAQVSAIVIWLNANGVTVRMEELRKRYRMKLPSRKSIQDVPPTREELRKILLKASTRWRALFSFLSATGMRPSEALVLRLQDLNPHPFDAEISDEVITVNVPAFTKNSMEYTTFCHPESARFLAEYLRELEKRGFDVEDGDFILFYNTRTGSFCKLNSAEVAWNRIIEELGLDDYITFKTKRIHVKRLYTLRKFFRTNLEAAGIPYGAVEAMLGHKQWYVRFSPEQLKKFYEKGMWALMVFRGVSESMVAELVEASIKPLREELEKLRLEMEKKELEKEKEFREVMDRLYRLFQRLEKEAEAGSTLERSSRRKAYS